MPFSFLVSFYFTPFKDEFFLCFVLHIYYVFEESIFICFFKSQNGSGFCGANPITVVVGTRSSVNF